MTWRRLAFGLALIAFLASDSSRPGPSAAPAGFVNEIVLSGLVEPTRAVFTPDGRLLVAERGGTIWVRQPGAAAVDPVPFGTLASVDLTQPGGGLLGLALDPAFASNGSYYVFYTVSPSGRARVSRFTAVGNATTPGSEALIWEDPAAAGAWHIGGAIAFGPDGYLYIATGDHQTPSSAANLQSPRGKILRIAASGVVPADNPFFDGAGPNRDEIWAIGLRSPTGLTFDLPSGRFFITDASGRDGATVEEINLGIRGANYGWPACEGACALTGIVGPLVVDTHPGNTGAVAGGVVYRGAAFPEAYRGSYFFGDYARNLVQRLLLDQPGAIAVLPFEPESGVSGGPFGQIVDVLQGTDGALYYVDFGTTFAGVAGPGSIRRLRFTGDPGGGAPVPLTVTTDGSNVAAWAFDEGSGATAADATGNGRTGTVSGPTWTAQGRYGAALSFDGANDVVTVADSAALNGASSFSFTAWVRRRGLNQWQALFQHGATGGNWGVYFVPDNRADYSEFGVSDQAAGAALTDTANWHHVAWIKSGDTGTNLALYIDGALSGTLAVGGAGAGGVKRIGGDGWYAADFFDGWIDNVRLYNRALTPAEVALDVVTPVGAVADTTTPTVAITSPTAGSTLQGTVTISASAADNVGVAGVQFLLDGAPLGAEDTSAPYSVAWNTTLGANGPFAISARVRDAAGNTLTSASVGVTVDNPPPAPPTLIITTPVGGATIVGQTVAVGYVTSGDLSDVTHAHFRLDGGAILEEPALDGGLTLSGVPYAPHSLNAVLARADETEVAGSGFTVAFTNEPPAPDTTPPTVSLTAPSAGATVFATVSLTANAADAVGVAGVQFFANGAAVGTEDTTAPYSVAWNTTAGADGPYTLTARARDTAGNTATSSGVGVTVNNSAPPAPSGVVAAWSFDEGSGTTATDASGGGSTGALIGPTWSATGRYGGALSFDGVNDYVQVPNTPALNVTTSLTVSAWVRRRGIGTWQAVFQQGATNGNWGLYFVPNNRLNFAEFVTNDITGTTALTDTAGWHHVAWVKNGNTGTNVTFYIDGVAAGAGSVGTTAAGGTRRLGGDAWWGADFFDGWLDNVRVYSRALSQAEVAADMAAPIPGQGDTVPPTVSLTAPAPGAVVAGQVVVSAVADDEGGIGGVQFLLDGAPLGVEDAQAPFTMSWDTTVQANGAATLSARARDLAGNTTTSAPVGVTIANVIVAPDFTPPVVSLTAPGPGSTLAGLVTLSATASDEASLAGVRFLVDGSPVGPEITTSPFTFDWDTTTVANAAYAISARARDGAGNTATTVPFAVTVENFGAPVTQAITQTTFLEFAACGPQQDIVVAQGADGEIRLPALLEDYFGGAGVDPSRWLVTTDPNTPGYPQIVNGAVVHADSAIRSQAGFDQTRLAIEARVRWPSPLAPFTDLGFGRSDGVLGSPNILFLVDDQNRLYSNAYPPELEPNGPDRDQITGVDLTEYHTVRLEVDGWRTIRYYVDGQLRQGDEFATPVFDDPAYVWLLTTYGNEIREVAADWIRVAHYQQAAGTYVSCVQDAGQTVDWSSLAWDASVPEGTALALSTRTSNDGTSWSAWSPAAGSGAAIASPDGRYLQYRAELSTADVAASPELGRVTVRYVDPGGTADTTPPQVSVTAPQPGATLAGLVNVTASATDDVGVAGVQFLLDGALLGAEITTPPYALPWDTTTASNGGRTLSARARDTAGNQTTSAPVSVTVANGPPPPPSGTFTQSSTADFAAGTTTAVSLANAGGGEVRLVAALEDYFDGPGVDPGRWVTAGDPNYGSFPSIGGGALTNVNSSIRSQAAFTPTTLAVEGRIRFADTDAPFADFGFGKPDMVAGPPNALFVTWDDDTLYSNAYHPSAGAPDRDLIPGVDVGAFHTLRMEIDEWRTIRYYVDGVLAQTDDFATPIFTGPAYLWFLTNHFEARGSTADWVRVAYYGTSSGTYVSAAQDAGQPVTWTDITWDGAVPTGTTLAVSTRTSNNGTAWSSWTAVASSGSAPASPAGRFLQYRLELGTTSPTQSPEVREVQVSYAAAP